MTTAIESKKNEIIEYLIACKGIPDKESVVYVLVECAIKSLMLEIEILTKKGI